MNFKFAVLSLFVIFANGAFANQCATCSNGRAFIEVDNVMIQQLGFDNARDAVIAECKKNYLTSNAQCELMAQCRPTPIGYDNWTEAELEKAPACNVQMSLPQ